MMNHFFDSRALQKFIFISVLLGSGAGCGTAPQKRNGDAAENSRSAMEAVARARKVRSADEIAPGHEVTLTSAEDPSLNGKYRVEFEGVLKLPYKVKVSTEGLTREALRSKIIDAYSKYYKTPPNITVSVVAENLWVEVRGLVEKPGRFLIKPSTSLDETFAMAGGLQKTATVRYVKIQQGRSSSTIKLSEYYSGSPEYGAPPWQGGDIIFLQSDRGDDAQTSEGEGAYVQLVGEVRTPGEYRYVKGADFYHYLVKAGGPTSTGDLGEIEIVRDNGEGKSLTSFGLTHPKDVPPIQSGDLIILKADKPTKLERTVPIVAGLVSVLNTVLLLVLIF